MNKVLGMIIHTAEAVLKQEIYLGKKVICKERVPKKYRLPELDNVLRKERLVREGNLIQKARNASVRTPIVYKVDREKNQLIMERINGKKLEELLQANDRRARAQCIQLGKALGRLHEHGIIHGDVTPSNVLIERNTQALVLIDFGLGFTSKKIEDQAVDLVNLKKILRAGNLHGIMYWNCVWKGYQTVRTRAVQVNRQMQEVEERTRYHESKEN